MDRENEVSLSSMRVRVVVQLVEALHYKVPVSPPGIVLGNFQVTYFFRPDSVALESTQLLTENSLGGIKCSRRVELTAVPSKLCRLSRSGRKPDISSIL